MTIDFDWKTLMALWRTTVIGVGLMISLLLSGAEAAQNFVGDRLDASGNVMVSLGTTIAGEDTVVNVMKTEQRFSSTYISTATTTTAKSGVGLFHRLVVTGGTAGTIICYDNTAASGTILVSFDSTNAIASYEINATYAIGLTCVTGAATKLTVVYR